VPKDNLPVKPGKSASVEWVFSASDDSWIELRNGPSVVVWSGVVKAGQSQQVQSPLPVSVVVGRAQGVSVTLRGQPFDLKPHTQVTVARFEVKE
jgi:cytoskeleton protein RodZ